MGHTFPRPNRTIVTFRNSIYHWNDISYIYKDTNPSYKKINTRDKIYQGGLQIALVGRALLSCLRPYLHLQWFAFLCNYAAMITQKERNKSHAVNQRNFYFRN